MADDQDEPHREFKGADLEALKPWVTSFNDLAPKIGRAFNHAVFSNRDTNEDMSDFITYAITGRRPRRPEAALVICPTTLRSAPMLLRELADMYEDLGKQIGLTPAKEWTPTKDT